jgi:hypothetical protein
MQSSRVPEYPDWNIGTMEEWNDGEKYEETPNQGSFFEPSIPT